MIRKFVFIFLFVLPLSAHSGDSLDVASSGKPLPSFLLFSADPNFSMRAATDNLLALHTGFTRLEDRLIGTSWFDEGSIIGKAGGVALRFGKLAFLDVPLDYFTVVVGHEYAGHGARYRELDMGGIHYAFDAPPPYGKGGGEATNTRGVNLSVDEVISIWAGGVESHPVLQQGLAFRWIERRRVTYREALLYFWATQIQMSYIQDTEEQLSPSGPDNDIQAYVRLLNFGLTQPPNPNPQKMDVANLKSKTQIGIANPFAFYSIYVALVTYLWQGNESASLPMLELGPVDYLPLLRAGWTPFGIEYHMENYFRMGARTALLDLRLGDTSFHEGWGGVAVDVHRLVDDGHWRLDAGVKLWNQPALSSGFNPAKVLGSGLGAAWSLRVYQDIHGLPVPLHAMAEIGYKTAGFVEGYVMDASPLLLMGLAVRY